MVTTLIVVAILLILGAVAIWISRPRKLSAMLGYPSDARLLIVHADDFGVCQSENAATIKALETGVVTSASVMVPCPAFEEAAAYCRENPGADIGVHLTFTNEYEEYNWGPVSPVSHVPDLVNSDGHFYLTTQEVWEHGSAEQIELEMRAQIEKALAAGIRPTHLDSHMGVLFGPKFIRTYLRVASEYKLPAFVPREYIQTEQSRGLNNPYRWLQALLCRLLDATGHLMIDRLYVGGLDEVSIVQDEYYKWVVGDLAPGVNEVLVHLALDSGDIDVLGERSERRVEDFRIMTDPKTRELIKSQGVTLIGFRPIMELVKRN
ncbi:MAG: polysaccharide deacetylase family protein [Deltaproteobacteria bacterium]|nr:polysaccharide deacetylase family protein [Deltaproteobacteria bacterium]